MNINSNFPRSPLLIPLHSLPSVHTSSANIGHGIVFSQHFAEPFICSSTFSSISQIPYQSFDESLALVSNRNCNHQLIYYSNNIRIAPSFNPDNISHLQLLQDPNVNFNFEQQQFASYALGDSAPPNANTTSTSFEPSNLSLEVLNFACLPHLLWTVPLSLLNVHHPLQPQLLQLPLLPPPHSQPRFLFGPPTLCCIRTLLDALESATSLFRRLHVESLLLNITVALLKAYLRFSNKRWPSERDRIFGPARARSQHCQQASTFS